MNFTELVRDRYSVREFSDKKVEAEKQQVIMEAARLAPTAKNLQPQRILTLESEEAMKKLGIVTPCAYGCTLAYILCYDEKECYKRDVDGKLSGDIDASIVGTHMMLVAYEVGVGSTWVMNFDPKAVREQFKLPESVHPTAILVMGYPADGTGPSPRHGQRVEAGKIFVGESF